MEILRLLPKNLLSRVVGWIVSLERPRVFALAVRDWFAKKYRLNLDEAEHPIDHYPSMAKLFVRRLKPGARPIADGIIHPCDSVLTQVERIESGMLVQAKGRLYSIDALLGEAQSPKLKDGIIEKPALRSAASFQGGVALTYYLCPTDYHRVHAPADLQLEEVV